MSNSPDQMGLTQARSLIRDIDREIDAARKNRAPDHHERECALFRRRGEAQEVCSRLELAMMRRAPIARTKKCPTCKGSGYAQVSAACAATQIGRRP